MVFRGLNLSIEFEGGTAWQVTMANGKNASTTDVRDLLDPLGFTDAKVSTLSGTSGDSVRVQAEIIKDPIRSIQQALADASNQQVADILFVRNDDGSGTFTFQTAANKTVTQPQVEKALAATGYSDAKVTVDGQNVTVAFDKLPDEPAHRRRRRSSPTTRA